LSAQSPPPSAPTAPAYSGEEKSFAAQIAALPVENALKTISSADATKTTEGLYRALHEIGLKVEIDNPRRAEAIFEEDEAVATRAALPILAADARFSRAQSMTAAGEIFESMPVFEQALEMYKAAGAPANKTAVVLLSRAVVYLRLGDLQSAIADDNEAARISRQSGDEVGVARADNGLGNAYAAQGSFSEAEEAFAEALKIAQAHGEKLGESFVLNNLSMLHAAENDYPMAVRFGEQSLAIKRQVGNKANLVTSLINLADYYDEEGREADANRVLTEAAQIAHDVNNKDGVAKATAEMGVIQLEHHHPEEALKLLQQGYDLGSDSEDLAGLALDLRKISEAYFDLKNYAKALEFSQKAAAIDQRAGLLDQFADDEFVEGKTYFALGQLKEARTALEASIGAIEQLRNNVSGGTAERQNFMAGKTDSYRLLAVVAAMEGDWPIALDSSERGKGRILLDSYTGNGISTEVSLTDAERTEETSLRSRYLSLDLQIDGQASLPGFNASQRNALEGRLNEAKVNLANFREQLYARHPDLRLRRADFNSLTAKDLQALIPDRSTALLEYELTENGDYLFVVTRGAGESAEINGYKLSGNADDLARHARRFHEQLATRDPDFAEESRWLYRTLIAPAGPRLKNVTSLVVVPDEVLWQVPFQALQQANGRFLVEDAAIDYIPSLAVLSALRSSTGIRRGARTLLALGNPGGETQEQADEVNALEKLYGHLNARVFVGKAATVGQFRESSPAFDMVHIAAHGIFDDREPMSSHMQLAAESTQPQAGWLRAREIQSMQLHAELVVLSGCETGKGSFEDGEGLVGMSWAALAAGAHGTLASAWRVEASSTTEMMIAFHQDILHGMSKSESLRRAELKLIHSDKHGHPFYWAAFVLMGDGAV
jgi:CHAT domain-containing protein